MAQDSGDLLISPDGDEHRDGEVIVVTGSRIAAPRQVTASPVLTLTHEEIVRSGKTNLTDFLADLPALVGSGTRATLSGSGADAFIGSTGLNLLNLRNLGVDRTLVLVNGRRHVGALAGSAAVDIDTIPTDLVERIDIVTGGQSAIYGADGVTGVVNFVMKRDFEGITARAQAGTSQRGDAGERLVSVTAGHNFAGGRGNFAIAYEYSREDRLRSCDRSYLCGARSTGFYDNPDDPTDDPAIPDTVPLSDVRFFDSARGGAIDLDFDGLPELLADGSPFDGGTYVPPYYQRGGSGTPTGDYVGDLLPSVERHVVNGFFRFDASDAVKFFAEAKFARVKSFAVDSPSFDFYNYFSVDNPFMPDAVRSQVIPGVATDEFGEPLPDGVLMNRDNFDLGRRGERTSRETVRTVVGLEGDLSDHLAYSASYTFGQTRVTTHNVGDQYTDRFYAAIDVVKNAAGDPVCRIALEGSDYVPYPTFNYTREPLPALTFAPGDCKPLDLFGEGVASQAAIAFVTADTVDHTRLTQHVASAQLTGDLGGLFTLPGGPVYFALGGEYRAEKSASDPDPLIQQGLTFSNVLPAEGGHYHVAEGFGEVRLPLLGGRPWAREVSLGGALRLSDYSTIGHTTTWNVDAAWTFDPGISLRGTYSKSVRAPNIYELFAASGQDFQAIDDPCDASNLNNGTAYREANCAELLTSLGVADPGSFTDPNSASVEGILGGNRNLKAETARTWTAGIVFRPKGRPGMKLSLDWYHIRLNDAVNTPDPGKLAQLCVDQPSLQNAFCDAITREDGSGRIVYFRRVPQNVSRFATAGLDASLDLLFTTRRAGDWRLRLVGNYLDKLEFIATPGAEIDNQRGAARAPRYQARLDLTWSIGSLTIDYGLSWFDKTRRFSPNELAGDPDIAAPQYLDYKARWVHDISASLMVEDRFRFTFGVRNVTDQKPAIGSIYYPVSAVGRFAFAGVEVKFGNDN